MKVKVMRPCTHVGYQTQWHNLNSYCCVNPKLYVKYIFIVFYKSVILNSEVLKHGSCICPCDILSILIYTYNNFSLHVVCVIYFHMF